MRYLREHDTARLFVVGLAAFGLSMSALCLWFATRRELRALAA